MALDGIVLRSISYELNNLLMGGRVDRIHQPEKDELLIQIRNNGTNYKLLLSASNSNPRTYITDVSKENPQSPPAFCMLLRKHLIGGKIIEIKQVSLERILEFKISSLNELGDKVVLSLIIEIMGKHSNIMLVDEKLLILDSIKRIPLSISSVRPILPNIEYSFPPDNNKVNFLDIDKDEFLNLVNSSGGAMPVFKFLYVNLVGLSPLLAKEICFRANILNDVLISNLNSSDIENLYYNVFSFYEPIQNNVFSPNMVSDIDTLNVMDFSAVELSQFPNYPVKYFSSISELLNSFYYIRDLQDRIRQRSSDLRKNISTKLERIKSKIGKQSNELLKAENKDIYRIKGDILLSNIHSITRGDTTITLNNYYSTDSSKIQIDLRPTLSPSGNVQWYYKRYNKLKTASSSLVGIIAEAKKEASYLENIIFSIDNSSSNQEIDEIRSELISEGYLRKSRSKNTISTKKLASTPLEYLSSDGFTIFVGKNNHQNDYLTLKLAAKDDLWLHVKDMPGSHVVVRSFEKDIPDNTLLEAALLAAYYSKGKESSNVQVDYVLKKHVRKPKGAKPGMVIYDNNSSIYVTPTEHDISAIKKIK